MNCIGFRKYIGAFADGELDVALNLEALEHLNMCPTCAARVEEITVLREALQRGYADVKASSALRARITSALQREPIAGEPRGQRRSRRRMIYRLFLPVAVAASLFVAFVAWPRANGPHTDVALATLAADARFQHRTCVALRGMRHHDASLPRDPDGMARVLGRELGMVVAIPDLTADGFALIGADRCGIRGRVGAHALYRAEATKLNLSLFTVHRPARLASFRFGSTADEVYTSGDGELQTVVWNHGAETYVACAPLSAEALRRLVDEVRLSAADGRVRPVLAAVSGFDLAARLFRRDSALSLQN